jgi:hypothetical protein
MNYPRVNLLKKSEQRYQGAVSRRFLLVSIIVTPILFITFLSAIKLIQYTAVKSHLNSSQEVWEGLEPRLELYKAEQRGLAGNKRGLELIAAWQGTKVPLSQLLNEIQDTVPGGVQLTRLAIRSEPKSSVYDKPKDFVLDYTLTVQGVAQGERAEDAVIGMVKDLLRPEGMKATFDSVELGSMRKRAGKDGETMREFRLTGSGTEGGGK